jgi:hypothetical protein
MTSRHLTFATWFADLLDSRFSIAGIRFGIDPLFNFIPVLGPILTFCLSLYLLWIAQQVNAPTTIKAKMIRNIFFDFVLGLVPVVGTVSDFVFRANNKNLQLLHQWLDQLPSEGEVVHSRRVAPAT